MSYREEKTSRIVEDSHRVLVCDVCDAVVDSDPYRRQLVEPNVDGWWAASPMGRAGYLSKEMRHFCPKCSGGWRK